MMNDFENLKEWIETGREVEFNYCDKRYSITYGVRKDGKEYISFCEFYKTDTEFDNLNDFIENSQINNILLKNLWINVTDIEVF